MSTELTNIEEVIADSIQDAELPADPSPDLDTPDLDLDTSSEATTTPTDDSADPDQSLEVSSPATRSQSPTAPKDDFEKKYGIPKESSSGRENRIPYSRVRKIVEKQAKEAEATYAPKMAEFETKIKDYEGRLQGVVEFEKVMVNDPARFLQMLSTLPAYKDIFNPPAEASTPASTQTSTPSDDMPAPDQKLSDGSMVYSMEGLKSLLAWNASQVESRVTKQIQDRYSPIENEWQAHQHIQQLIPKVQAQIADARTWPQFTENEEAIVKALQADPSISLERAYQKVVFPKLASSRDEMRAQILKEIKRTPTSTSAPVGGGKPGSTPSGPRSLEDVIADSIKAMR